MTVTAENVETELQRAELVGLGCDLAQGFLFGRAVPSTEVMAATTAWPTDVAAVPTQADRSLR